MPLEQYGSLIERLKAEEQERLQRYQESQTPLQADPAFSGAVPLEADTDAIARAEEWRRQNPPPQPSKLLTLGNVLSRLGARMEGRRPPEWVQPNDPLADFRDKMTEIIATQGMNRNTEQWKQGRIDKRREQDFERSISPRKGKFEDDRKAAPSYMHPSQEAQNNASAYAARAGVQTDRMRLGLDERKFDEEQNRNSYLNKYTDAQTQREMLGSTLDEGRYGLEQDKHLLDRERLKKEILRDMYLNDLTKVQANREVLGGVIDEEKLGLAKEELRIKYGQLGLDTRRVDIEEGRLGVDKSRRDIEKERADTQNRLTTQEIESRRFSNQVNNEVVAKRLGLPQTGVQMEEVPLDQALQEINAGAPYQTHDGSVISGGSSTAPPANINQMLQKNTPANQYRDKVSISVGPTGTTTNIEEVLTPEAQFEQDIAKARATAQAAPPGSEETKGLGLALDIYDSTNRMRNLYDPNQLGLVANALGEYLKYGALTTPEHIAMRSEVVALNSAIGFLRSGAAVPINEREMNEIILPDLRSGDPQYFLRALQRITDKVREDINFRQKMMSSGRGDVPSIAQEFMQRSEQANPGSPAYQQATQGQQYPKGAPPGLVFDPRIGKWRMP